jgi:hypothetical protein
MSSLVGGDMENVPVRLCIQVTYDTISRGCSYSSTQTPESEHTTWMRTSASIANVRQGSSLLPETSNSGGTWAPSQPSSSPTLSAPRSSHHTGAWSVKEPVLLELGERLLTHSLVLLS